MALTATSSTAAAVTLSASGLPTGVRLSGRSLSGVVTRQGTFHVTVSARDASGAHASTTFTWKVRNHTIVATKRLTVSGTLKVGKVVKAVYGSLRFDSAHGATAHASAHFQWFANGKPIKGAHGSSLKVTAGLRGKHLTFTLTATAKYANKYSHGSGRTGSIK